MTILAVIAAIAVALITLAAIGLVLHSDQLLRDDAAYRRGWFEGRDHG